MSLVETIPSTPSLSGGGAILVPTVVPPTLDQSLLLAVDQMRQLGSYQLAGGTAAVYTCRSPGKLTANEDASAFVPRTPDQGVLIVADGLGGHANGGQASRLAVEQVVKSLENLDPQVEELRPAILDGIESANTAVCALGNGSASTLAIAEIRSGVVRTYHVGDSAILLTGSRGRVKLQTIAHSPIGYAVESGMIDEADAIYHEDRHMISNVIGTNNMRIEIGSPIRMAPRDRLVLASDGLFDNLFPHEIVEMVRIGPVSRAVVRLASEAISRMVTESANVPSKPDDLTIIGFGLTR